MALGIGRTKILAVLFGPQGIGLLGLLQAAMSTATLAVGVGVDGIGARELARALATSPGDVPAIRAAMTRGVLLLAATGGAISAVLFGVFAEQFGFGEVGIWAAVLGLGVLASVMAANGRGALAGHGRVAALAQASIAAAVLAVVVVVPLSGLAPTPAVVLACIAVPVVQWFAVAGWARGLPGVTAVSLREALVRALGLARMAGPFFFASVLPAVGQFGIRAVAANGFTQHDVGLFQASLALSTTAAGVLASGVGPSLVPRLAAAYADPVAFNGVLTSQVRVYLSLFAPIVLVTESAPELILRLLYSEAFIGGADQLCWQMVGEVFRLPIWAMSAALFARGRGGAYLLVEIVQLVLNVGFVALAVQTGSLAWVGAALSAVAACMFVVMSLLLRSDGFRWPVGLLAQLAGLSLLAAVGAALARESDVWRAGAIVGTLIASAFAARTVLRIRRGG